jgi:hypothetical protein
MIKRIFIVGIAFTIMLCFIVIVNAVNLIPSVKEDPLVRMPGTQPDQGVKLEAPTRCLNCHGGYNQAGKLQFITSVNAATTTYTDTGLTVGTEYC